AFHEEPHMPPEDQVKTWMLVFYSADRNQAPEFYWPKVSKRVYEVGKTAFKTNDDVKRAAASAVGDAATPEQKVERLFDFCRTKIKNVDDDASGVTDAVKSKLKNESPADTLKHGMGTGVDIGRLFGALAIATGFDARLAVLGDRSDMFFDPHFCDDYFLTRAEVAIKFGEQWRFFDPSSPYLPFGMLRWEEEGVQALIADPKQGTFVPTPLSTPDKTVEKRTASLTLAEDGTLEGDINIEYTGHLGFLKKEQNSDDSPAQREQNLSDMVKKRLSTAEVTNVKIENVNDPVKPFTYSFHVRVPGYAQKTGKRLFLQPGFFERGIDVLFSGSTRKHAMYFHFPWSEEDEVTIKLPSGFELDNADAPQPFHANNVAGYDVKIMVANKNEALIYKRKFVFQALFFPVESYAGVKKLFDVLHENDNHTITLKQTVTASK